MEARPRTGSPPPRQEDFAPSVTYRWSPEAGAYVGPKGGGGELYARLESWDELWSFLAGSD